MSIPDRLMSFLRGNGQAPGDLRLIGAESVTWAGPHASSVEVRPSPFRGGSSAEKISRLVKASRPTPLWPIVPIDAPGPFSSIGTGGVVMPGSLPSIVPSDAKGQPMDAQQFPKTSRSRTLDEVMAESARILDAWVRERQEWPTYPKGPTR